MHDSVAGPLTAPQPSSLRATSSPPQHWRDKIKTTSVVTGEPHVEMLYEPGWEIVSA